MNYKERLEIIKHITLGTNEVLYYPYNSGKEPLPVRPISSFELDQCFYNALDNCENDKIASFVVKYRIGLIKGDTGVDISNNGYKELISFYNEIDYWVVYFGMKDFQKPDFSKTDFKTGEPKGFSLIRKMSDVHKISSFIFSASIRDESVIVEIFSDNRGQEVAKVVYYLNVPLSDFSKITKLQRDYLIYSKGKLRELSKKGIKDTYIKSGDTMTYLDLLRRFK